MKMETNLQRGRGAESSSDSGAQAGQTIVDPAQDVKQILQPEGIEVLAPISEQQAAILTPDSLRFVAKLVRRFWETRQALLQKRVERQKEIDGGTLPDFLKGTEQVRKNSWSVAPVPKDLQDRRVE